MGLTLKQKLERENFLNTLELLEDAQRQRQQEARWDLGGSGALGRNQVSVTGFIRANRNHQIAFAASEGLILDPEKV